MRIVPGWMKHGIQLKRISNSGWHASHSVQHQ